MMIEIQKNKKTETEFEIAARTAGGASFLAASSHTGRLNVLRNKWICYK